VLGFKIMGTLAAAALGAVVTLAGLDSGPKKGEALSAFEPTHVTGADARTDTCPVCKYGNLPAVQVWVNGNPTADVKKVAATLERRMVALNGDGLRFKTFMIFKSSNAKKIEGTLSEMAKANHLREVALTWLPPTSEALKQYQINPGAETTVLVYKNRQVTDKFVNLKADAAGLKALNLAIEKIVK
jgi:hypothetical protein